MPELSIGQMVLPGPGKITVLVETKSEITPQGLYIPVATARGLHEERPTRGIVVSMNLDMDSDEAVEDDEGHSFIEIGDVVLFGKYTGTRVEWTPPKPDDWKSGDPLPEKQVVIVMRAGDVLAKLLTPEQAANLKVRV